VSFADSTVPYISSHMQVVTCKQKLFLQTINKNRTSKKSSKLLYDTVKKSM